MITAGRAIALSVAAMAAVACGDDGAPEPAADASPMMDAAPRGRISVPATEDDLSLPFGVHVTGEGSLRVGSISVLDAGGHFEILGHTIDVAVYQRIEWPEVERDLYQTLAVAADRIYVVWFYCNGTELAELYVEGTDGTYLDYETATGTCTYVPEPSSRQLQLPAIDMPWPEAPEGFAFDGAQLELDGTSPGRVVVDGVEMMLLPFEQVDCSACPPSGWYELHALLWDETARRLCFGIFYMMRGDPGSVDLDYGFCLPDLQPIAHATFAASWTVP